MSLFALNTRQTLALALTLLTCSIGGLLLTVQSMTNVAVAESAGRSPAPASAQTTVTPAAHAAVMSTLTLGNPLVTLDSASQQLLAQLTVQYRQNGKTFTGAITITGQPRFDANSKQFYLEQPVIRQLTLASVSADRQQEIYQAVSARLPDYFANQPVYAPLQTDTLPVKSLEISL